MIPLLLLATAAARPSPEQLEDATAWEHRARRLLDGPEACVEVEGRATFAVSLFTPGGWLGPGERQDLTATGRFVGTLDHGTWTRLVTTWADASADADQLSIDRVHPMVGRPPPEADAAGGNVSISVGDGGTQVAAAGGGEQALGLLDEVVAGIDPSVTTSFAAWDEGLRAVMLRQFVPLPDGQDLELRTAFPDDGEPTRVDAFFPPRTRLGDGLVKFTVINGQLHLRGQETPLGVLPAEEGASLVLGVLGFTVGVEQRLTYDRARPCPTSEHPP